MSKTVHWFSGRLGGKSRAIRAAVLDDVKNFNGSRFIVDNTVIASSIKRVNCLTCLKIKSKLFESQFKEITIKINNLDKDSLVSNIEES